VLPKAVAISRSGETGFFYPSLRSFPQAMCVAKLWQSPVPERQVSATRHGEAFPRRCVLPKAVAISRSGETGLMPFSRGG